MSEQQQLTSQSALQQQQSQQQQVSQQQQPQQQAQPVQQPQQQQLVTVTQGQQVQQQQQQPQQHQLQQQQQQHQIQQQQQQLQQQIQQHHAAVQQQQQQPRASTVVGSVSMVAPQAAPTPQPTLAAAATGALRSPGAALPQLQVIGQPLQGQPYLPSFQGYAQSILLQNQNALAAMNQMNQLNLAMQQQQQQQQQQNRVAVSVNSDGSGGILSPAGAPQMTHMSLANGGTALIPGTMQGMLSQAAISNNGASATNTSNNTSGNGKGQQQQGGTSNNGNKGQTTQVLQAAQASGGAMGGATMVGKPGSSAVIGGPQPQSVATPMVLGQIGVFSSQPNATLSSFVPQSSIAGQQAAAAGIRLQHQPQPHGLTPTAASVATVAPGQAAAAAHHHHHQQLGTAQQQQQQQQHPHQMLTAASQSTVQSLLANQALMQAMASLQMQQQGIPIAAGQHQILGQGQAGVPTIFAGQNFLFRPAQGPLQQQPITMTSMQAAAAFAARPQQQQQLPQQQQIVKTNASGKVMLPSVTRTPITAKIQPNISQQQQQQQVRPISGAAATGASPKPSAKSRLKAGSAGSAQQVRTTATTTPTTTVSSSPTRGVITVTMTSTSLQAVPSALSSSSVSSLTSSSPASLSTVSSPIVAAAASSVSAPGATIIATFPASVAGNVALPTVHQVVASVIPTSHTLAGPQDCAVVQVGSGGVQVSSADNTSGAATGGASSTAQTVSSGLQASPSPVKASADVEVKADQPKTEMGKSPSSIAGPKASGLAAGVAKLSSLGTDGVTVIKPGQGNGSNSSTAAPSPAKSSPDSDSVRTQIGDVVLVEERKPFAVTGVKGHTVSRVDQQSTTTSSTATTTTNNGNNISTAAMEAAGLMTLVKEPSKPMTIVGPSPQTPLPHSSVSSSTTTATAMVAAQPIDNLHHHHHHHHHLVSSLPPSAALVPPTQSGEKQRAIVKPQILTHIIEGFVIQEGSEPFPVQQSSLLQEFIPPKASVDGLKVSEEEEDEEEEEEDEEGTSQDDEPPTLLSQGDAHLSSPAASQALDKKQQQRKNFASGGAGKGSKGDKPDPKEDKGKKSQAATTAAAQKLPPKMLKCELCQKIGPASTFSKSGRFCSTSCSGRHNVSHTRRVGLFKSKGSARKRKMLGRKNWRAKKGRSLTYAKTGKNAAGNDNDDEDEDEEEEENTKQKTVEENIPAAPAVDEMSSSTSAQETSSSTASPARSAQDGESMELESAHIPNSDPGKWTVVEVHQFIYHLPGCREYAEEFRSQEIDGQALLLLKEDHLMTAMNIKLGPALKICSKINSLRAEHAAA